MSALSRRIWGAAPLSLALLALALRASAPKAPQVAGPAEPPRPFVPPLAFLAAAHAPGVDESWEVDGASSRAHLELDDADEAVTYQVSGTFELAADESLGGAELVLTPLEPAPARARTLRLQLAPSPTRSSPVPGLHAARPAVRLVSEEGSQPTVLELTWMRLPGPSVTVQAVTTPALELARVVRPARGRQPWERASQAVLSLSLKLAPAPDPR